MWSRLSCFSKISRARRHMHELAGEMREFRESKHYEVVRYDDLEMTTDTDLAMSWKLRIRNPIPSGWGLIVDDVVTNLRSALDHALYSAVIATHPLFDEEVRSELRFPISENGDAFNKAVRAFHKLISTEQLATLQEFQPYRDEGNFNPLRILRSLSSRNEHRVPRISLHAFSDAVFEADLPGIDIRPIAGKTVEDGYIVATATLPRPAVNGYLDTKFDFKYIEHIEVDIDIAEVPAPMLLESIYDEVFDACTLLTDSLHNDVDQWFIDTNLDAREERWAALSDIFE